jgi:segregation and condensation protein B
MNKLEQKIEAILIYKNEPVSFLWLSKTLDVHKEDVQNAINEMHQYYENRGITLVVSSESVCIMTADIAHNIISDLAKTHEEKELSKQALETLSIILYKERVTKSEIDYIRGVNSVFILRNLLIRGLIKKKKNLLDKRSPIYVPTHDLLSFLGISQIQELPEYEKMQKHLVEIEQQQVENNKLLESQE